MDELKDNKYIMTLSKATYEATHAELSDSYYKELTEWGMVNSPEDFRNGQDPERDAQVFIEGIELSDIMRILWG